MDKLNTAQSEQSEVDYKKIREEQAKREEMLAKPWAESTDEERVEKLRDIVQGLERSFGYFGNRIDTIERSVLDFRSHKHVEGQVVVPVNNSGSGLGGGTVSGRRKTNLD